MFVITCTKSKPKAILPFRLQRGMARKAVTCCESNPASHLPISTPNPRTYNSIAQSQCTENPQVDVPYASNTQCQMWPVGQIPTAWELCGTDRNSNLCKGRMQVPSTMCQGNTHESSESADGGLPKLPAMFCEPGGDWNDDLGPGHAIISGRQDDPTSAFDTHTLRILAVFYEDWGPLDLDEDDQETITEAHGLTPIPSHQYLYDPCNQVYVILQQLVRQQTTQTMRITQMMKQHGDWLTRKIFCGQSPYPREDDVY